MNCEHEWELCVAGLTVKGGVLHVYRCARKCCGMLDYIEELHKEVVGSDDS